jgi:hypothetical protein
MQRVTNAVKHLMRHFAALLFGGSRFCSVYPTGREWSRTTAPHAPDAESDRGSKTDRGGKVPILGVRRGDLCELEQWCTKFCSSPAGTHSCHQICRRSISILALTLIEVPSMRKVIQICFVALVAKRSTDPAISWGTEVIQQLRQLRWCGFMFSKRTDRAWEPRTS